MAIVITNQSQTINFSFSNGDEYNIDKANANIRKKGRYIYVYQESADREVHNKLKFRYSEVTSPVFSNNDDLITELLTYKSSTAIVVGSVSITDGVNDLKIEANGSIPVTIQDSTEHDISLYLGRQLDTLTLPVQLALNISTIDITTTGVVPVIGNYIFLQSVSKFSQFRITSVALVSGNRYTVGLSMPTDHVYPITTNGYLQNINLNVNGSVTPQTFELTPKGMSGIVEWDITRMLIQMTMTSAGDDGLFGNLPSLTNGVYFRTKNGEYSNMFNARENSDFGIEGFDVVYPTRSGGGGTFGFRSRISFNGADKRGIVKRLHASSSDSFQAVVRDNLTGITSFKVKLQGQVAIP